MKKILRIIYYLFFACLAFVAILMLVSVFPIAGNYRVFVVQSGSMEPAIKMGSVVVVKPAVDYKVGDVITFGQMAKTKASITHRIYEVKERDGAPVYITKGDANNTPDQNEISKKEIIGKVLVDLPYIGYAVNFAKKPAGFIFIIAIPAAIIVFDEIIKIKNEVAKIKQKNKPSDEQEAV